MLGTDREDSALATRRGLIEFRATDRLILHRLVEGVRPLWPGFLDGLYDRLGANPETAPLFVHGDVVKGLKGSLQRYLEDLFTTEPSLAGERRHAEAAWRVGAVHHRLRVSPDWFVATYAHFVSWHVGRFAEAGLAPQELGEATAALLRAVFYDISLVLDAYGASEVEALRAHKEAVVTSPARSPAPETHKAAALSSLVASPMASVRVTAERLDQRVDFLGLTLEDRAALAGLRPALLHAAPPVLDAFYAFIGETPALAALAPPEALEGLKSQVASYWRELASADFSRPYAASRVRIGMVHERIGLDLTSYLAGLGRQAAGLIARIQPDAAALSALVKAIFFDASFVIDAYMEARRETLLRADAFADRVVSGLAAAVAVLDEQGRVVSANPAMLDLTPGAAGLIYRLPIVDALPIAEIGEALDAVRETGRSRAVAFGRLGRRPFRITAIRLERRDGFDPGVFAMIFDDLSDVLKLAQQADEATQGLVDLIHRSGALLFQMSPDTLEINTISRPVMELTGYRDVHFLGVPGAWMELVQEEDRAEVTEVLAAPKLGVDQVLTYRILTAAGTVRTVRSHVIGRRDDAGRLYAYVSTVDAKMELALDRLQIERDLAREQADKAEAESKAKSEFLAQISHELRNPMTGVLGLAHILEGADLPEVEARQVRLIVKAGEGMLGLLNDILDLARIASGRLDLSVKAVDLADLVEEVGQVWSVLAAQKHLGFNLDIAPEARGYFLCDPVRVRQILVNLVSNAVKFTRVGSVTLSLGLQGEAVLISVSDTGPGVSQEDREKLFLPYEQGDAGMKLGREGAGLGLSVCRRLARLMGGQIRLAPGSDEGAVFEALLPLGRAPAPALAANLADASVRSGLKILVAEDNAVNRLVIETVLQAACVETCVVENGAEAIEQAVRFGPDLILMDLHMPVMDGEAAARRIRKDLPHTRIIALTGDGQSLSAETLQARGFDGIVLKPFTPAELVQAIQRQLAP